MGQYKISMYKTDNGKIPFITWLESIKEINQVKMMISKKQKCTYKPTKEIIMKNKNLTSWDNYMNETLQDDCEATAYLELAIEEYQTDGDTKSLMRAIQRVAEAKGGISKLAEDTKLNRQNLYRIFANQTSPRFDTLTKILRALGFTFSLKSFNTSKSCA